MALHESSNGSEFATALAGELPRLVHLATRLVRDADEAEDVMQEAYVRAYACLDQFEGRAKFSAWLTKIAVHEASARRRRQARVRRTSNEGVAPA